jgi:hypothetical protein
MTVTPSLALLLALGLTATSFAGVSPPASAPAAPVAPAAPFAPATPGAPAAEEQLIVNGNFEEDPTGTAPVPGWTVAVATGGDAIPVSIVETTSKDRHTGRQSLRLFGDIGTSAWQSATQQLPVRPGATYRLSAWTKTQGVKREGGQFEGCSLTLTLLDARSQVLTRRVILPGRPRERWMRQNVEVLAPPSTRHVQLSAFLSMSGEFWVDDVELELDSGWDVPLPDVLLVDRFDGGVLSQEWTAEFSGQGRPSRARPVELADGRFAMHFTAEADTGQFVSMARDVEVAPEDTLYLMARVRGEGHDGGPVDFRATLRFLDEAGEPVGEPQRDEPRPEALWKDFGLVAVVPAGAVTARLSAGLLGPGEAWLTDIELLDERSAPPPYTGWLERVGTHVELRLPPDHPETRKLKTLVRDLDRAATTARAAAGLSGPADPPARIWLYQDAASCQALAGADPPHVDAARSAIHALDGRQAKDAVTELFGGTP